MPVRAVFIGQAAGVHVDEGYVTGRFVDLGKPDPLVFESASMSGNRAGHQGTLDMELARAWSVGREVSG